MITEKDINTVTKIYHKLYASLDEVLVGQTNAKMVMAVSLLCDRNSKILLQGNVGAGKTTLANALRNTFPSERISVTSDLLPSDIQNQLKDKDQMQVLQIDEFNRMNGKSQTSLVEVMAEHKMTLEGKEYLYSDFNVIATQNPEDTTGIFSIPQAIYDRFDVCIDFKRLTEKEKKIILFGGFEPATTLNITKEELEVTSEAVSRFSFNQEDEDILMQSVQMINAMCIKEQELFTGDNIRADKFFLKVARLVSMLYGKSYVAHPYIVDYIPYIYGHRVNPHLVGVSKKDVKEEFYKIEDEIASIKRKKVKRGL